MLDIRFGAKQRFPELERLICAAMSNQDLARQLVTAPELALDQWRHSRNLSPFERKLVLSIRGVVDIYEFAAQLYARTQLVTDPNAKTLH